MKMKAVKNWLVNRAKGRNKDGGKAKQGEKSYMFQCSVPKEFCQGAHNGKIQQMVHGSKQGAMSCVLRYKRRLTTKEVG